jgi:uncharacterized protein (DUF2235 family)
MGKNIVLLADGTGNSEASPFKTNVWRLYQAVDTQTPGPGEVEQVAFYDNGVGTETFKPLQMLGLALGIGVARNVKSLYTFLCRNYKEGDNIYLFGFSRGAFTVRVLAGLILRCGVVTWKSEQELTQHVKLAYAEYKRDVARRATKTRPWLIAGQVLGGKAAGAIDRIDFGFDQLYPRIAFIGVWDTVDAYGVPIDELKEGIDRYVWPMTLADRGFSDHVDRACHALSLDDERPTFRPVLWTDPDPAKKPERLSQVWFAGVHANVGGGYPDDSLACVSLQWMMDEAHASGLRFYRDLCEEYDDRADPHGKQYDSRSGVGGYYRYGPRDIAKLCDDRDHGVRVARPQIHASVLERIRGLQIAYAPVSVTHTPNGYDLYGRAKGPPMLTPVAALESADDLKARAKDMESAYDAVFRRRFAYLCTVALTVVLAWLPFHDKLVDKVWPLIANPLEAAAPKLFALLAAPFLAVAWIGEKLAEIPGWSAAGRGIGKLLDWIVTQNFLPGWASFWIESFARHPALFLFCGLAALWLFVRTSQLLQDQVFARADYAWSHIKHGPSKAHLPRPASSWTDPIVRHLRTNPVAVGLYRWVSGRLIPFLFALIALPIGLLIIVLFFIPKILRNLYRRRTYKVRHLKDHLERISGTHPRGARAA